MMWTVEKIVFETTAYFQRQKLESARLDAELLVAHVLQCSRTALYTAPQKPVTPQERTALRALIVRRIAHEPIAYILGEREFYGLAMQVTPDVLIPRPETEHLVEVAQQFSRWRAWDAPYICEIGVGSGAVSIALAKQLPKATLVGVDLSTRALGIAQKNCARHGVDAQITLVHADTFCAVDSSQKALTERAFDLIISNPPYIRSTDRNTLDPSVVKYEPEMALFSGDSGLEMIRKLSKEASAHLHPDGMLAFEMGYDQAADVADILRDDGWKHQCTVADLAGHLRVACAWNHGDFAPRAFA